MNNEKNNGSIVPNGFKNVPIEILVSVGVAKPRLQELLQINEATVIPLNRKLHDNVDLYVGENLIAVGQLVELGEEKDAIGVKIIEVFSHDIEIDGDD